MKIIILQNIKNLGQAGDVKDVADGYALNFLIPRKLAVTASPEAITKALEMKKQAEEKKKEDDAKLMELAKSLNNKEVIIPMKEKKGKLFGSVGKKEIADKLGNQINEDMIELKENIKAVGERKVTIDFGNNIKATINVKVEGE